MLRSPLSSLERLLDFGELDIPAPELDRVVALAEPLFQRQRLPVLTRSQGSTKRAPWAPDVHRLNAGFAS